MASPSLSSSASASSSLSSLVSSSRSSIADTNEWLQGWDLTAWSWQSHDDAVCDVIDVIHISAVDEAYIDDDTDDGTDNENDDEAT